MSAEKAGDNSRVSVVVPRLRGPRTLSADRIDRIQKTLSASPVHGQPLAGPLRGHPVLTIGEVSGVNAQGLFDDLRSLPRPRVPRRRPARMDHVEP